MAIVIRELAQFHKLITTAFSCGEVVLLHTVGRRFSPGTPVSSAIKTDHTDMTSDCESGVKAQSINTLINPSCMSQKLLMHRN